MNNWEYHKIRAQLAVLKDLIGTYPCHTIGNIIQQLESRKQYYENKNNG